MLIQSCMLSRHHILIITINIASTDKVFEQTLIETTAIGRVGCMESGGCVVW